jgi:membrane-associated phospholipid phosphatase
MNFLDFLSMSAGIVYIIPAILYIVNGDALQLKGLIGVNATTYISEGIKYGIIKNYSVRPKGARDCDAFCRDGNQSGKPGMPSSHSATMAFFTVFYIGQTQNVFLKSAIIIYSSLVILSRYLKRCHTVNQILIGTILGSFLGYLSVRHL